MSSESSESSIDGRGESNGLSTIRNSLDGFAKGIKNAVEDISALEVNTMIVSQITGAKFDPKEKYDEIRKIPTLKRKDDSVVPISDIEDKVLLQGLLAGEDYLEDLLTREVIDSNINKVEGYDFRDLINYYSKKDWYQDWLEGLDEKAQLPKEEVNKWKKAQLSSFVRALKRHLILKKKLETALQESLGREISIDDDDGNSREEAVRDLFVNHGGFRRKLRKLGELKAVLENSEAANSDNLYDVIYAQTIVQIDGDVINRFDQRLFQDDNKEFLLEIHRSAVASGEEDWRNLLNSVVDLAARLAEVFSKKLF